MNERELLLWIVLFNNTIYRKETAADTIVSAAVLLLRSNKVPERNA